MDRCQESIREKMLINIICIEVFERRNLEVERIRGFLITEIENFFWKTILTKLPLFTPMINNELYQKQQNRFNFEINAMFTQDMSILIYEKTPTPKTT